ncbi:MAG: MerR family transcriptional regulator, partial [Dehalococcoidia bacterium]
MTRTWSTGQLARAAGITARTLRHYEQIGLLVPTRTAAGRRAYSAQDVTRLYRILGLRKLGLSLDEVAATLDSTAGDLASVVRRHIEEVDIAIAARQALRVRLRRILA